MNARPSQQDAKAAGTSGPSPTLDARLCVHQLGLSAAAIRDVAFTVPVWAAVMTVMMGGVIPDIGNTSQSLTWPWIVVCAAVSAGTFSLWHMIKRRSRERSL